MAIKHISQAYKLTLGYELKFIMIALADNVDCNNQVKVSLKKLSAFLGMPEELLIRNLKHLIGMEYLREIPKTDHEVIKHTFSNIFHYYEYIFEWKLGDYDEGKGGL